MIHDVVFLGANPLASGAPLPEGFTKRPPIINLNLVPLQIPSVDVGPFGLALPPDSSESGRARNKALTHVYNLPQGPFGPFTRDFRAMMESLGAVAPADDAFTAITMNPDVMLQACSPSLEYPRSDLPANIKFIGCLPCKTPAPTWQYPEWWSEVVGAAGSQRKRIVGVAQGTVALDYNKLAVPAMQGLAGRDDVLVVVVLGVKGATLPEGTVVPANARVVDVLPYEALLPHLDVWVINSGYGGFTQGVMHGVPMLLAGDTEDKAVDARRVGRCRIQPEDGISDARTGGRGCQPRAGKSRLQEEGHGDQGGEHGHEELGDGGEVCLGAGRGNFNLIQLVGLWADMQVGRLRAQPRALMTRQRILNRFRRACN